MYVCLFAYSCQEVGVFVSCYIWMHRSMYVCSHVYSKHMHISTCTCMPACPYTYMYIHVYKRTCIHFFIYLLNLDVNALGKSEENAYLYLLFLCPLLFYHF